MPSDDTTSLAPRPARAVVGHRGGKLLAATDEYAAVHRAALDALVRQGLDAVAATLLVRAEAARLAGDDHTGDVVPSLAATEAAIAELHDDFRRFTVHVLRMARSHLGLS